MLWHIRHTTNVMSRESYDLMENGTQSLGWSAAKGARIGYSAYNYSHSGAYPQSSKGAGDHEIKAWASVFSTGHVIAFSSNSKIGTHPVGGKRYQEHILEAFKSAREPKVKKHAREALPALYLLKSDG